MTYFKEVVSQLEENYKRAKEKGYYNCIPFMGMSRLEEYVPGIEQESYTIITAGTGIGKSKLTRHLYIDTPMHYSLVSNKKVKIFVFSLEESKRKFFLSEMSKRLFTQYGMTVSINKLQSIGRNNMCNSDIIDKMHAQEKYMTELFDRVQVIDYVKTPDDIAEYLYAYADRSGTFEYSTKTLPPKFIDRIPYITKYMAKNPDAYTLFIVDHVKLMIPGKGQRTVKEAIDKMSATHCVNLRNICRFTPILVQQQAADKEKKQYTFSGTAVQDKNRPSLDGLGEHKLSAHDADIVIGLYAPDRYGYSTCNQYDITRLQDTYREMSILKNRNGRANIELPLFFNGASSHFEELPNPMTAEMNAYYALAKTLNG